MALSREMSIEEFFCFCFPNAETGFTEASFFFGVMASYKIIYKKKHKNIMQE